LDTLNLYIGKEITDSEYREITKEDQLEKAKKYVLSLLNRKSYSEFEITKKLKNKGFSKINIFRIVNWLKEKEFINDEEFALCWAQTKIKNRPLGRYKLIQDLKLKGINQIIINKVINKIFSEYNELSLAQNLVDRKIILLKQKKIPICPDKIYHFLLRRGFPQEISETLYKNLQKIYFEKDFFNKEQISLKNVNNKEDTNKII